MRACRAGSASRVLPNPSLNGRGNGRCWASGPDRAQVTSRTPSRCSDPATPMRLAWSPAATVRRREILRPSGIESHEGGIKAESRTVLLRSIALARKWLDEVLGGSTADQIALRERCSKRHIANTIPLAFLAPDLVRAVIDARLPRGISATRVAESELEWSRQWEMLGIRP